MPPPIEQDCGHAAKLRICVLEFGLRNRTGHHYNSALSILAAADEAGFEVCIFAGDTLTAGPEFVGRVSPLFRTDLYARSRLSAGSENLDSWKVVGDRLALDLQRLPAEVLADADIVLVPAVSPFHIWALCKWAKAFLLARSKAVLVVHFMFQPTWSSWGRVCAPGPQMYREALALLSDSVERRTFLTAELETSAREFERAVQFPFHVLPHPAVLRERSAIYEGDGDHKKAVVGVFGNSKREKGFHFLPKIISQMGVRLQEHSLRFLIQVDHDGDDAAITDAAAALIDVGEPQVEILSGSLSIEAYWAALERIDLFLLPYDPTLYGSRGSGLLSEAATLGVPIVGPAGTGIAEEVAAGRAAGVVFDRFEPGAIAAAGAYAIENLPELHKAAVSVAARWRETNSGVGYLRKLRAVTGL